MTKKDIAELKRRFKKEDCTFTRLCGCYVDAQKNIVLRLNETFLNLVDEEFFKYLEIAKKTLSGTVGNNLLELEFLPEEETGGVKQQFLLGLRDSRLKNEALLERFYELIIDNYDYIGNYLILIFHDAYDVMTKTSDNQKIDESEEVYDYLLCAVCPVELTKAGLGYREDENRIGARVRDWVVSPPENGFVFPAFSDRSGDIHSIIFYTKNAKEPRRDFMREGLGCIPKRTAAEEKGTFQAILKNVLGPEEEAVNEIYMEIQQNLNGLVEEHHSIYNNEPALLTEGTIQNIMSDSDIPDEVAETIKKCCQEEFGDTPPLADNLIDAKALAAGEQKRKEQDLQKEVFTLRQQLEETVHELLPEKEEDEGKEKFDILLKVNPQKVPQIKSEILDGKKYLLIPLEDNEQANINGVNASV